ncbi:MAG: fused MFS/spermidine synthase [Longimicrobiales bacterium]
MTRSGEPTVGQQLPAMLLLFIGSGCAALIYEIVWFQMVQLVIGSSGVSIGVLLGTFMGGMCLGSFVLPRFIPARHHPLRVYAVLEAGIGVFGLLLFVAIPLVGSAYSSITGHGFAGILLRGVLCVLLLLPPTILMGATLPAISRWIETTPRGVSWMGFFYAGNITGAVMGSVLAGFYLLRVYDTLIATFAAFLINAAVAGIAYFLSGVTVHRSPPADEAPVATFMPGSRLVYLVIALSGLTALGAQVVWTRLLSLLLGATVYTFSIILAVFLTGLGIGSGVGSFAARMVKQPRFALGLCQILIALGLAWTATMLARSLPYWPVNPSITANPWFLFQIDVVRTLWAILPATVLWGASFPLAVAATASPGQDPARLVGGVYAANTVGAIAGAVGFGMLVIPSLGTQGAQQILILLAAASALLMFVPIAFAPDSAARATRGFGRLGWAAASGLAALVLVGTVAEVPPVLIAYGRYAPTYDPPTALYVGEGMNASVAVTVLEDGTRNFHVSGKIEASTEPQDMRLQRMLGHISALLHPSPRTVLVVGLGAGVTAGSFVLHPSVERIVICEIEPLIPQVVARHFGDANYEVLKDPRVEVVHDDARHYILTSKEKFDVITSDPIHPWVKGAATLYTREYFELAKRHLNPGGVITQWVPLYESNAAVVKSELATFFEAFPNGTVWSNDIDGRGYDVVLAGGDASASIDLDALDARLSRTDHAWVQQSLSEVGFPSIFDLLATYAGRAPDLAPWLADAEINHDRNLRLMYIAGMGANLYQQEFIYSSLLGYRRFPRDLFTGSAQRVGVLRALIAP